MIRAVHLPVNRDLILVYLTILFAGAWVAMARHVYTRRRRKGISLAGFMASYSVRDYLVMTRRSGSIGIWFWIFAASFVLIVIFGVLNVIDGGGSSAVIVDGNSLWPIL